MADPFDIDGKIDYAVKQFKDAMEVAIAHALGAFELDEAKILAPLEAMANRVVDRAVTEFKTALSGLEDRIVAKIVNLRITQVQGDTK
jgi:predicted negative regulator of RcsB-dependent stress response